MLLASSHGDACLGQVRKLIKQRTWKSGFGSSNVRIPSFIITRSRSVSVCIVDLQLHGIQSQAQEVSDRAHMQRKSNPQLAEVHHLALLNYARKEVGAAAAT